MAKQIRAARHYREKSTPLRRIADEARPKIAHDLKAALKRLSELLPADANQYVRRADWHGLKNAIDWHHFREVLKAAFASIGKAREDAARHGERQINGRFSQAGRRVHYRKTGNVLALRKDAGDRYAFDLYSPDVQAEVSQAQADLIDELEDEARDAIDNIVRWGSMAGLSPDDIMDDIRDWIGLTARQSQAVANYRSMLESLDPQALQRQLRNVLEDDAIQTAIDNEEDLAQDEVDKLVDDYADNYLDYRAATIADTESTRAVNAGLQDSYAQAIDRGVFPSDAVRQHWKIDLDEVTCPVCLSIPDMNPDGVAIDESFDSIDGPQDAPPVHPNCRCDIEIVTDLDMLPDDGE